jgi:hypothetical protein
MLAKLQAWAKRVWTIASSPAEYRTLRTPFLGKAIKYLYVLLLAISFLFALKTAIALAAARPALSQFMENVKQEIPLLYPEELVLTLSGGKLSTNVEEPYSIALPASWRPDTPEVADMPKNLLTIDTNAHIEDFESEDSFALATETALVMVDRDEGYRVMKFDRFSKEEGKTIVIDRALYLQMVEKGFTILSFLPLLLVIFGFLLLLLFPFLMAGSLLLWMLFYLLLATLFSWILAKIMKSPLGYKELYRLGVFALTLPILISIPMKLLGIQIPGAFSLIFFIFLSFIIRELKEETETIV